ncbi:hypothetical protein ES702_00464 [subsurface metagenome]
MFGRSTRGIALTSPHIAGLRQIFVNREQQAILAYALGRLDAATLLKSIIPIAQQDLIALKNLQKEAVNISQILSALITAPESVTAIPPTIRAKLSKPTPILTKPLEKKETKLPEKKEKE